MDGGPTICTRPRPGLMTHHTSLQTQTTPTRAARAHLRLGQRHFDSLYVSHVARRFAPHFYDRFAIGVVESGTCRITTSRGEWVARQGTLLTFSPGELHTAELVSGEHYAYRMIYLSLDALSQLDLHMPSQGVLHPMFRSPVLERPAIARMFRAAHCTLMSGPRTPDDARQLEDELLVEVRQIVRRHLLPNHGPRERGTTVAAVERAAAILAAPSSSHPCLTDVADECNMSTFHLIRVFRRLLGVSPYAYYSSHRINRARQLLNQGLPVSHVAYVCGFSDQSHLTRMFKRALGLPPGQYTKALQQPAA